MVEDLQEGPRQSAWKLTRERVKENLKSVKIKPRVFKPRGLKFSYNDALKRGVLDNCCRCDQPSDKRVTRFKRIQSNIWSLYLPLDQFEEVFDPLLYGFVMCRPGKGRREKTLIGQFFEAHDISVLISLNILAQTQSRFDSRHLFCGAVKIPGRNLEIKEEEF